MLHGIIKNSYKVNTVFQFLIKFLLNYRVSLKRGISKSCSVCPTLQFIMNLKFSFLTHLKISIHLFGPSTAPFLDDIREPGPPPYCLNVSRFRMRNLCRFLHLNLCWVCGGPIFEDKMRNLLGHFLEGEAKSTKKKIPKILMTQLSSCPKIFSGTK